MPSGIRRSDIVDTEVVDQVELGSDGTVDLFTGVTVVSTTSGTKRVVVSGVNLINGAVDERLEANDKVTLAGTSGGLGDGTFTVASIVDDTTFEVVEAIGTSTGGTATAKYPPGAKKVGLDPTGLTQTTSTNVQDAIKDIDGAIAGGGITEAQHELLDTLTHWLDETNWQEMVRSGGKVTNAIHWETSAKLKKVREVIITRDTGKVSQIDIIQYDSAGVEKQRLVLVITRTSGKVSSIQWTKTVA